MMKWLTALSGAFSAVRSAAAFPVRTAFGRAVAVSGVCALALAGCNAVTTSDGGGGDGINDAALGVAASPRVTDQETNLPRGGGRAQVGRPYRIAGRLYTPREDPNYDRTGIASWYGPGFHGRLTANGEVFDQYTLSAAHPTLPLPSYVRVTNLENDRSVMVRVNDRGPFAHDRIIDLSKRAADVLAFRGDGIARVRVEYEGRAPLHGQDVAWLEASAEINGRPINGGDPNIMLARAPVPAPTPAAAPAQAAFVATSGAAPVPQQGVPQRASFLDTLFGQPQQPQVQRAPAITPAVAPAGSPMVLAPPSGSQACRDACLRSGPIPTSGRPRTQCADSQARRLASWRPTWKPASPSAISRPWRKPRALSWPTAQHPRMRWMPPAAWPCSRERSPVYPKRRMHRSWRLRLPKALRSVEPRSSRLASFGDPANVARLRSELSSLGEVVTQPIQSRGRELTQVRLRASAPTRQAEEELLRRLASQGYTDAYVTDANG
jgi:rare lipoprotein A